jgi:hypothetical protein
LGVARFASSCVSTTFLFATTSECQLSRRTASSLALAKIPKKESREISESVDVKKDFIAETAVAMDVNQ